MLHWLKLFFSLYFSSACITLFFSRFALGALDPEVVHVQVPAFPGGAGEVGGGPAPVLGAAQAGPGEPAHGAAQAPALLHRLLQPHEPPAHQGCAGHPNKAVLVKPDLTPPSRLRNNGQSGSLFYKQEKSQFISQ